MKNPKTTSVLVGLGLVLGLAYGYAQGNRWTSSTHTFINNTGQAVGGLHIQYGNTGSFFLYQTPYAFTSVGEDGSGGVSLSSGTVEAGGSVQILILSPAGTPRVKLWWWTDGSGILVGEKHRWCTNPDCTSP